MKQFENGQQVIVEGCGGYPTERYTYIGRMPADWNDMPHAVQNDLQGLRAVADGDIKAAPVKKGGWINIYPNKKTSPIAYSTKETAEGACAADRITTIFIEWEE